MIRRFSNIFLYVVFLVFLCEGVLWLVASFSETTDLLLSNQFGAPRRISDPLLGHRLNPDFAEHDEWGYRNALTSLVGLRSRRIPAQVDIVALGDSQTYGINAPAEGAWPAQLADQTCKSVYNMAVGATGPPHYLYTLDQALSLKPKLVIVGFYFGNDFWDSAAFVYRRKQIPDNMVAWRQAFRDNNPDLEAIFTQQYPRAVRKSLEAARILEPGFSKTPYAAGPGETKMVAEATNSVGFLRENSKLYGFIRLAKATLTNSLVWKGRHETRIRADPAFWDELCDYATNTPGVVCYEKTDVQTVLDTRLRIRDERILEAGMEITLDVLAKIQNRLRERKTEYLVVLIPTKEYIYTQALPGRFEGVDPSFLRLGDQEGRSRDQVKRELTVFGVPHLDLLPALVRAVRNSRPVYPASSQSHPSTEGYRIIAQSIAQYLQEANWGDIGC
jgi:lysophospholipase L1-like esterase